MRHAGGVPVLALPSRFGVDPILPCPPWSRQPSERRAPKGTISALGGTLSTPLNATMSVGRHLVRLRAENWPRPVLTVTSLGPCSPGTTGLSLMIAWLCASRSKIPPSRYPLKAYRADWEPEASSGRRVLGVFWRCPAVLWGPSTPNPTQVSWKTLILKNWLIFPASCGYVVVLPHVAQVRFWRPKRPHSE